MTADRGILVRRAGETAWSDPDTSAYENESHLQDLLAGDPSRIPGVSQAVAARELFTSAGPIDVVAIQIDGSITVIECKLASSSEKRRMVLGQVVDYASAIWRDGTDAFLAAWEARTKTRLAEVLGQEAVSKLRENIEVGRIHLCLVVDAIDDDLQRLIEYLNLISRPDVSATALQLSYAKHGDVEILIPSTFGGEIAEAKARAGGQATQHWTWGEFLEALASEEDRQYASDLRDRILALGGGAGEQTPMWFGAMPGGSIFLHPFGRRIAPASLWINSKRQLLLYGTWNNWTTIDRASFEPIARALGQDTAGGAKGVPAQQIDINRYWNAILETSQRIVGESSPEVD